MEVETSDSNARDSSISDKFVRSSLRKATVAAGFGVSIGLNFSRPSFSTESARNGRLLSTLVLSEFRAPLPDLIDCGRGAATDNDQDRGERFEFRRFFVREREAGAAGGLD